MKKIKTKKTNISNSIPNLRPFYKIEEESYINENLDNSFVVFNSINKILYIIYSTNGKSIISFDLNNFQKISEINGSHNKCITNFKHYLDIKKNRDLIMSISKRNNTIKIWDFKNWNCISTLTIKYFGNILAASFINDINDKNQIYLISNINTINNPNSLAILDFKGNIIKNIKGTTEIVVFIDTYYDKLFAKMYIIFGKLGFVESYDYIKNKIYHRYVDYDNKGENLGAHYSVIVNDFNNLIRLIESSIDGFIRLWDFHSGILIKKIKVGDIWLYGICLWNDDYLYVGTEDNSIKLIDLNNGGIIKSLDGHDHSVLTIKKAFIPKYGYCLISQERGNSQIKLWKNID